MTKNKNYNYLPPSLRKQFLFFWIMDKGKPKKKILIIINKGKDYTKESKNKLRIILKNETKIPKPSTKRRIKTKQKS